MSVELLGYVRKTRGQFSTLEKLAISYLADYGNNASGGGYYSVRAMAEDCECNERQLRRVLSELERRGWLRIERSTGGRPRIAQKRPGDGQNHFWLNVDWLRRGGPPSRGLFPADNLRGLRAADGCEGGCDGDVRVEAGVTLPRRDGPASGPSPRSSGVGLEKGGVMPGFFYPDGNPDKGGVETRTRGASATRKREHTSNSLSAEGVSAGASRGVSGRAERFTSMLAIRARWKVEAGGGLGPADIEALDDGARNAAWMRRVGPLLDRWGRDGVESRVRAWIEAHEDDEVTTLWDVLGGMLSAILRTENTGLTKVSKVESV